MELKGWGILLLELGSLGVIAYFSNWQVAVGVWMYMVADRMAR